MAFLPRDVQLPVMFGTAHPIAASVRAICVQGQYAMHSKGGWQMVKTSCGTGYPTSQPIEAENTRGNGKTTQKNGG